jgi:hypothetical protein
MARKTLSRKSTIEHMRIRYETTTATFIQFIIGAGLSFVSGVASIISGCHQTAGADCVSNAFVSLLLIIFTIFAYGFLLGLGFVAQDRRSSRLAFMLIGVEAFAMLVFLFDAKQSPAAIDKITNGGSFLIAAWVAWVAWHLARARGGRIVRTRLRERKR